jgi:hypothetical protein
MKAVLYGDNNIVTNIIVWDSESSFDGQNHVVVEDSVYVSIGWNYVNGAFINPNPEPSITYAEKRSLEYPPITDYIDGVVKGNQAQIDKYIADCQAVKDKYPKVAA